MDTNIHKEDFDKTVTYLEEHPECYLMLSLHCYKDGTDVDEYPFCVMGLIFNEEDVCVEANVLSHGYQTINVPVITAFSLYHTFSMMDICPLDSIDISLFDHGDHDHEIISIDELSIETAQEIFENLETPVEIAEQPSVAILH